MFYFPTVFFHYKFWIVCLFVLSFSSSSSKCVLYNHSFFTCVAAKEGGSILTIIQMADQFDIYLFRMGIDQEFQLVRANMG